MASNIQTRLNNCIESKKSFILKGGAGSGKTYSLIQTLNHVLQSSPDSSIACITFTNVAADEIKNRSPYENFWVSTIHEFLWDNIKHYQKNLKAALLKLIADDQEDSSLKIKTQSEISEELLQRKTIVYREFRSLSDGIISHDEVLKLAHFMFRDYKLLRNIVRDKFDFVFIDEYQDTEKIVIDIFLDYLMLQGSTTIGLFGDPMQSIYDQGVGEVNKDDLEVIQKKGNRRCSRKVIQLLNKLRTDEIQQEPVAENLTGSVTFLYSESSLESMSEVKEHEVFLSWDFESSKNTKELYLTHRLISKQLGFSELLGSYKRNDRVTDVEKHDPLLSHLYNIQELVTLYENEEYNMFVEKTDFTIRKLSDKQDLRSKIDALVDAKSKTIQEFLKIANETSFINRSDSYTEFVEEEPDLYENIGQISYLEIANLYDYLNQHTPLSTQHNIKGAEFENVLVVMDNGGWNMYNFKYLFGEDGKDSIIDRTRKIFYVCCSRAKNNLVVFFDSPNHEAIRTAKEWFGEENVVSL